MDAETVLTEPTTQFTKSNEPPKSLPLTPFKMFMLVFGAVAGAGICAIATYKGIVEIALPALGLLWASIAGAFWGTFKR